MTNSRQPGTAPASPRWGAEERDKKALAILTTLRNLAPQLSLQESSCVDTGCGSGEIAFHLAGHFKQVVGVDPEPWEKWHAFQELRANVSYLNASADNLPVPDNSVDVVVCNQVYEHVPDAAALIREIYRVMKPGAVCYFAGPNLLFPIEPHVFWPFVHWLPRRFAVAMMRSFGSRKILDATSTHLWQLRKWLKPFETENALPFILRNPQAYGRYRWYWQWFRRLSPTAIERLTWLSPTFAFVIRKPLHAAQARGAQ